VATGDEQTPSAPAEESDGRRFLLVMAVFAVISVAGVGIVEWIDPPLLSEDVWTSGGAAPWVVAVGVALLLADVLLPVPSNVVMIFLGAAVGFPAGAALSWLATSASALLAFGIGRRLGRRVRPPEGLRRRLRSHAVLVIAMTRPVPVLAETTAVAAGMVPSVTWRQMAVGSVLGTAPPALLFAAAGAYAHGAGGLLLIAACLLLDIVVWYVQRRRHQTVNPGS
jgi:uncharacterized membrane protein YdjX (TVP38/TMEM64 family)